MALSSPSSAVNDNDAKRLSEKILSKLAYSCAKTADIACDHDWYMATALAVRDHVVDQWIDSQRKIEISKQKQVYYFSVEYLIGRLLFDTLTNLQMVETARTALF